MGTTTRDATEGQVPRRRLAWPAPEGAAAGPGEEVEWMVANGLGGYAAGTAAMRLTRRFHGLLVAALPAPLGRVLMLPLLVEEAGADGDAPRPLGPHLEGGRLLQPRAVPHLEELSLELGVPTWRYRLGARRLERSVRMPHDENTVHVTYVARGGALALTLRPFLGLRGHEAPFASAAVEGLRLTAEGRRLEIAGPPELPPLRLQVAPEGAATFTLDEARVEGVEYELEAFRGYDHEGSLWSPGRLAVTLEPDRPVTLVASTEPWEELAAPPAEVAAADDARRARLVASADPRARTGAAAELVLAADPFIVRPAARTRDQARARAGGGEARTVIAGYPWFTDWGRDTMISLEGLCLVTGRHAEARDILATFALHVRDGLIPNLFPEGETDGLYNTADATLWFLHALHRYEAHTGDRTLVTELLPALRSIVEHHVAGTHFGIGVDADGLLRQGAEGTQLTWMDAKVDGWVVTPRRGKAVEINALWYSGLRLVEGWMTRAGESAFARDLDARASAARARFNERFWNPATGHLFDVVDGPGGDDPVCRPNQVLAIALPHPVLDRARWPAVLEVVRTRLLTPMGLRSLAPGEPGYAPRYGGDLRTRDAAYHQGTVWAWLIGPFVDAVLAARPDALEEARGLVAPLVAHLGRACAGSISEIFDADPPHTPRGCYAQAWSVAEVLRVLVRTGRAAA